MSWPSAALGEIAEVEREVVDPSIIDNDVHYVGLEHIDSSGEIGSQSVGLADLKSAKFAFAREHVLFGKLRPYLRKIARPNFGGICSTDIIPIRPGSRVNRDYLFYVLRTDELVGKAAALATGINLPRLSPSLLERFEIPLPPLFEQRRIAGILDQAENLRRKRREALATAERLLDAAFTAAFTGEQAGSWPIVSVAEVSRSARTGPFGSQLLHSEFTESGVAVLGIDNAVANEFRWAERRFISEAKYRQLSRYRVFPRDVLITIMATCGRAAIVPDDIPLAINTKHLCCLSLDEQRCLPEFLHASFLRDPNLRHQLGANERGAVMPGLNMGLIRDAKIRLPPLRTQLRFAACVAEIDKLKAQHRAHLGKLDALFASLQYRAFRGDL